MPAAVGSVVERALEKSLDERFESATELADALEASTRTEPGAAMSTRAHFLRRPAVALPFAAVLVGLLAWTGFAFRQGTEVARAHEEAIPELLALLDRDDCVSAFSLAMEIERVIPADPILANALARAAVTGSIVTEPAGAEVYIRRYGGGEEEWRLLGQSPIEELRLPRGDQVGLRIEKDGFDPLRLASGVPGLYFGRGNNTLAASLTEVGAIPSEMVFIPGGNYPVRITGFNSAARMPLEPFLMDRYEVTNAEYAEFVEAGGYPGPGVLAGSRFRPQRPHAELGRGDGRLRRRDGPAGSGDVGVRSLSRRS